MFQKMKLKRLQKKIADFHQKRQTTEVSENDLKKEIAAYWELAKFYKNHLYDKKIPRAEILLWESYRAAAILGDAEAQYVLSDIMIKRARFWEQVRQSPYGQEIHTKYIKDLYDEAFHYLKLATQQDHPLATRLNGLAYINAWGVEKDEERGLKLVVESIDLENAWDQATKIFTNIGLNRPEFFSTMMSLKKQRENKS